MKKLTKRKRLDKKCLDLWSLIVRLPQKCFICGREQSELNKVIFQGHHIISRRYSAGRWTLKNGRCICVGCHVLEKFDPERFRDNVINAIGEITFNELKEKYMRTCKVSEGELQIIYTALKLEYKTRLQEQG
jgi:hypothetical protein